MLNFGETFSETHIVANTRSWSFIVEKLQRNSCGVISNAYHSIAWHEAYGTGKMRLKEIVPEFNNGSQQ